MLQHISKGDSTCGKDDGWCASLCERVNNNIYKGLLPPIPKLPDLSIQNVLIKNIKNKWIINEKISKLSTLEILLECE